MVHSITRTRSHRWWWAFPCSKFYGSISSFGSYRPQGSSTLPMVRVLDRARRRWCISSLLRAVSLEGNRRSIAKGSPSSAPHGSQPPVRSGRQSSVSTNDQPSSRAKVRQLLGGCQVMRIDRRAKKIVEKKNGPNVPTFSNATPPVSATGPCLPFPALQVRFPPPRSTLLPTSSARVVISTRCRRPDKAAPTQPTNGGRGRTGCFP